MKPILACVVAIVVMMGSSAAYAVQPDEIMSAAGDSDAQVIDFLVARYGEFVLLKPRLKPHTLLLWLLPPLALAGGGFALWTHGRRRSRSAAAEDQSLLGLTAEEEARLERLTAAEPPADNPA
jgi:cytochrome c-type biogenesis protein CcmH